MSASKKAAQRLVVLGASGFVGGHVAKEAIRRGLNVLCLSRKGKAPPCYADTDWARKAEWSTGDALQPETYREKLDGANALVVSIGSPPLPFVDFNYQVSVERTFACSRTSILRSDEFGKYAGSNERRHKYNSS